jgi:hypothetical protein
VCGMPVEVITQAPDLLPLAGCSIYCQCSIFNLKFKLLLVVVLVVVTQAAVAVSRR